MAKAFSESGVLEDEPPGKIDDPVEKGKAWLSGTDNKLAKSAEE